MRDALLARPLERLTPATIVDPVVLRRELAAVARNGIAYNREESQRGLLGVAAPIRAPDGSVAGALALAFPRGARTSVRRAAPVIQVAALGVSRTSYGVACDCGRARTLGVAQAIAIVVVIHRDRALELADALADRASDFGKTLRAEDDESEDEHDQKLAHAEVARHSPRIDPVAPRARFL